MGKKLKLDMQGLKKLGKVTPHLLPCHINYNGPAKVCDFSYLVLLIVYLYYLLMQQKQKNKTKQKKKKNQNQLVSPFQQPDERV